MKDCIPVWYKDLEAFPSNHLEIIMLSFWAARKLVAKIEKLI